MHLEVKRVFENKKGLTNKIVNPFKIETLNDKFDNPFQKNVLVTDFVTPSLRKTKKYSHKYNHKYSHKPRDDDGLCIHAHTHSEISRHAGVFAEITELALDRLLLPL